MQQTMLQTTQENSLAAATVVEVVGKLKLDILPVVPVKYWRQPSGPSQLKQYINVGIKNTGQSKGEKVFGLTHLTFRPRTHIVWLKAKTRYCFFSVLKTRTCLSEALPLMSHSLEVVVVAPRPKLATLHWSEASTITARKYGVSYEAWTWLEEKLRA